MALRQVETLAARSVLLKKRTMGVFRQNKVESGHARRTGISRDHEFGYNRQSLLGPLCRSCVLLASHLLLI
jgi:hypothetical protein